MAWHSGLGTRRSVRSYYAPMSRRGRPHAHPSDQRPFSTAAEGRNTVQALNSVPPACHRQLRELIARVAATQESLWTKALRPSHHNLHDNSIHLPLDNSRLDTCPLESPRCSSRPRVTRWPEGLSVPSASSGRRPSVAERDAALNGISASDAPDARSTRRDIDSAHALFRFHRINEARAAIDGAEKRLHRSRGLLAGKTAPASKLRWPPCGPACRPPRRRRWRR
jgi:hypothetical protein